MGRARKDVSSDVDRRRFLQWTGAGLASAWAAGCSSTAPAPGSAAAEMPGTPDHRPNVLFIAVDDLNQHLGCYGNPVVRSPNIDRLAARGVRFVHAYPQAATCVPSRYCFLSGMRKTTIYDPEAKRPALDNVTWLPAHFREQGYFTARVDKVFHIGRDVPTCWDITEEGPRVNGRPVIMYTPQELRKLGIEDKLLYMKRYKKEVRGEGMRWGPIDVADEQLPDGMTARRGVELLRTMPDRPEPFFLALGFRRPHLPWHVPPRYFDMYPPESIQLPPEQPGVERVPEDIHRAGMRAYYAALTFMDTQLGLVLDEMDRLGLWDDTIVVLFGDNGYALGERDNFFSKWPPYESATAVPLIVAAPHARLNGQASEHVVELIDIYPSLVDYCGLPKPEGPVGRSFVPLLNDADADWTDYGITEYDDRGKNGIRSARYRYTESADGEPLMLYDLEEDPYEHRNLVAEPAYADTVSRLSRLMHSVLERSRRPFSPQS